MAACACSECLVERRRNRDVSLHQLLTVWVFAWSAGHAPILTSKKGARG